MPLVGNIYRPDFEADPRLPTWQQIGDDQQGRDAKAVTGSFVDMLKSRMAKRPAVPMHGDLSHPDTPPPSMAPHEVPSIGGGEHGLVSKGIGGANTAGGMKSL